MFWLVIKCRTRDNYFLKKVWSIGNEFIPRHMIVQYICLVPPNKTCKSSFIVRPELMTNLLISKYIGHIGEQISFFFNERV